MKKVNLQRLAHDLAVAKGKSSQYFTDLALERIKKQCEELPHGSGIDSGVEFDLSASKPERLVFNCPFHHMNANGYYCGWTTYRIIIKPAFGGFDMRITGKDRYFVKEYLYDLFNEVFE